MCIAVVVVFIHTRGPNTHKINNEVGPALRTSKNIFVSFCVIFSLSVTRPPVLKPRAKKFSLFSPGPPPFSYDYQPEHGVPRLETRDIIFVEKILVS